MRTTIEKDSATQIVPRSGQALALQSTVLVRRGLQDLARDSSWLIKKLFTGRLSRLAISSVGQVCADASEAADGRAGVSIFDIELAAAPFKLSFPGKARRRVGDSPTAFAWSPCGRYLVTAAGESSSAIHVFDVQSKSHVRSFERFEVLPVSLAWSSNSNFLAAAFAGGKASTLRLWKSSKKQSPVTFSAAGAIGPPDWIEPQSYGEEFREEAGFWGYGRMAFSPDNKSLAAVVELRGEWADDLVFFASLPSLRRQNTFQAQGHITDLSWTPDNQQIIFCAAGQAYLLSRRSPDQVQLPFAAELCRCHPSLRLAACFCSWLKNSAKGRLFLADLSDGTVLDECPAEGVVDLRWSGEGTKLYAVTQNGLAYLYDKPLL